ncbi:MAG: hypothetical protein H6681_02725 [Desulfobacteraceae bacterium]|nr:hypothetical protein [Desulfobacteraceae bacterium]
MVKKVNLPKTKKVILFFMVLSGISASTNSSGADFQIKDKTNSISYIYYHENRPLESDMTVKIESSGKASSVIKKLKPFSKNPHSISSWEKYEKTVLIGKQKFFELVWLLNKIEYDKNKERIPCPGQSIIEIKICFNDSKCNNFKFYPGNEKESFKLFRDKLYESVY